MATLRIADEVHPKEALHLAKSQTQVTEALTRENSNDDGIYNIRSRFGAASQDRLHDQDPDLRKEGDYRTKQVRSNCAPRFDQYNYAEIDQVFKGKMLLWLTYQSIGVIYGDIGTSPLYVYSSTFSSPPTHKDLVGVLSLIIWSIFMMVTVKYVLIILHADNDGEGGTFSTYSLLSRYVGLTPFP